MKMTARSLLLPILAASLVIASNAHAQETGCSFATCALRIDHGFLRTRIVAGQQQSVVAKVTGFGTDLATQLALPDSAAVHVRRANSRMKSGTLLGLLGLGLTAAAAFVDTEGATPRLTLFGVGVGFAVAGTIQQASARSELSQAIWWYNRQFAH
jgi:hypothetical protein